MRNNGRTMDETQASRVLTCNSGMTERVMATHVLLLSCFVLGVANSPVSTLIASRRRSSR